MHDLEPRDTATAAIAQPVLPTGDDERFIGFGVMGLPFESGHYLTLRNIPATSFGRGYRAVWHRDPEGEWTFYATAPPAESCPRFFGAASTREPVQCDIDVSWRSEQSLAVRIDGLLDWRIDVRRTFATWLMSTMGAMLPEPAWSSRLLLSVMGRAAGPMLGVGRVRLQGVVPNGQAFTTAPVRIWAVRDSTATIDGVDIGRPGPLPMQTRLGDFWLPQKGIFASGFGHFEAFDPGRHHRAGPRLEAATPSEQGIRCGPRCSALRNTSGPRSPCAQRLRPGPVAATEPTPDSPRWSTLAPWSGHLQPRAPRRVS